MRSLEKIERITPQEVGVIMGTNAETIRAGLRANRFPFRGCNTTEREQNKMDIHNNKKQIFKIFRK